MNQVPEMICYIQLELSFSEEPPLYFACLKLEYYLKPFQRIREYFIKEKTEINQNIQHQRQQSVNKVKSLTHSLHFLVYGLLPWFMAWFRAQNNDLALRQPLLTTEYILWFWTCFSSYSKSWTNKYLVHVCGIIMEEEIRDGICGRPQNFVLFLQE